jgi:hypothetical protein
MGSEIDQLIRRLRALTAQPGKRSELARFLGVPMPRISEWLSGVYEPGGEVTLLLLKWVESQERIKQSGPGSVTSTARAQTRKKQIRS